MSGHRTYGPHDFWSDEKPPSPKQWSTLATLALELIAEKPPETRRDASVLISRMQLALGGDDAPTTARTAADDIPL